VTALQDPYGILHPPSNMETEEEPEVTDEEAALVDMIIQRVDEDKEGHPGTGSEWEFNKLLLRSSEAIVRGEGDISVYRAVTSYDGGRTPVHDNEIASADNQFIAKMLRAVPGVTVDPQSGDRDEVLAAEVRNSFIKWFSSRNHMRRVYKRLLDSFGWAGIGIAQLCWDPLGGRKLQACVQCGYTSEFQSEGEFCPVCGLQGMMDGIEEAPPKLSPLMEGEPRIRVLDPRQFVPESGVTEIFNAGEAMRRCSVERLVSVAELRQLFPQRGMLVKEDESLLHDRFWAFSQTISDGAWEEVPLRDHTRVIEFHALPSGLYPQGILAYVANDRLIHFGPNKLATLLGRLPFFEFRPVKYQDSFWSTPRVSYQRGLQTDLNRLLTATRDHRAMTLLPRVVVDEATGLNDDDFPALSENAAISVPRVDVSSPLTGNASTVRPECSVCRTQPSAVSAELIISAGRSATKSSIS